MSLTTINITLTEEAAQELTTLIQETNQPDSFLRVWVAGGGCSGLQYGMALDNNREEGDIEVRDKDITIVVDSLSAQYLEGATIQYRQDMLGGGFKIENPNAKHSCGCGSSFTPNDEEQSGEEQSCQGCKCN